jgi:hypothetical protein
MPTFQHVLTGAVLAGAAMLATAIPAAADNGTPGQVEQVCANELSVRDTAGGAWFDYLYRGENFLVYRISPSGEWAYGHAYGRVHKDGWVQNGWFC